MNILIVEDSATLRLVMKNLIEEIGHTSIFAASGEEALQIIGEATFELVIMDVEMPGLNGLETTTLMREAFESQWVPIILTTSNATDENILAGINAGGDDYLIKPFSRPLLEAKIKAMHRINKIQQQLTQLNSELAALSERDGLTQLLNRRTFTDKANQSLLEARRQNKPCALLMIDVDHFKQYNDSYGHVEGDECLINIANIFLRVILRESDLVARYGGEEFVILLPKTDQEGAMLVGEKILSAIAELCIPHRSSPVNKYVTLSIGIDIASANEKKSLDTLIHSADKNLYRAKEQGRNGLVITETYNNKTILITDDREQNLSTLTQLLQPLGNIITADCENECIELAKNIKPDLIIIDSDHPRIIASKIDQILKQHVRTARTPLLLLSSTITNNLNARLPCSNSNKLQQEVMSLLNDN